jgi:hypothetical protein
MLGLESFPEPLIESTLGGARKSSSCLNCTNRSFFQCPFTLHLLLPSSRSDRPRRKLPASLSTYSCSLFIV